MRKNNILLYLFLTFVFLLSPESVSSDSPSSINEIPLQYTPTSIAASPPDNTAFAVSENYKTLYKVDLKSLALISSYVFQDKPRDVAVSGDRVYVPAGKDAKAALYVFDKDLNLLSTVDIGKSPASAAVGGGIIAVGCENNNTVYVINEASLQISYTLNIGMKPNHVEIDKKRNEIIVSAAMASNFGTGASEGGTVLFLDLSTGNIKRNINTVQKIKDLKINSQTDRIVLTNAVNGIDIMNPDTMIIEQQIELSNAGAADVNQSTGTAVILSPMTANILSDKLKPDQLTKNLYDIAINPYTNQAAIAADNSIILLQLPNPRPEIMNLVPRSARSGEAGFSLLVEGKKFITTSSVQFNQNNLTTSFKDNEELEAQVPSSLIATPSTVPVTVTNPAPDGGISEPYPFTIKYPIPILSSISPNTIAARSPDFTLKVYGSNFYPGYTVNFNGQDLATTYINSGELNAIAPSALIATKGIYLVVARTPDGQNSNFLNFTVTDPYPVITDFTPKSGRAGTVVTITGDNFNYTPTKVLFNNIQATIQSLSQNEIKVIVPIGATTGPIKVETTIGSTQSAEPFTVLLRNDFALNLSPQEVSIPLNGNAGAIVSLQSTGLEQFTSLVTLSLSKGDSPITATFNPENISLNQSSILNIKLLSALSSQPSALTIIGTANIEGIDITRTASITLNPIPQGATTITGRIVRSRDAAPIKGVTLTVGDKTTVTDEAGNFLFIDIPVGEQTLMIDGGTANTPEATYPSRIPVPVTIIGGIDNKLPYFIYLHEVNTKTFTPIDITKDTIVTDPEIKNFEMKIPAGVQIIGWDGLPNEKVSVTLVPMDRLPIKPPPEGVYASEIFMYYFGKPGGGIPTQPIPVKMPNTFNGQPGDRVVLWYYDESPTPDPNSNQWKTFGMGTVSDDGKNIIPDPGVGIPKFCCGASRPQPVKRPQDSPKGAQPSPKGGGPCNIGGNSVDPYNGMQVHSESDMGYPFPSLISLSRRYKSDNTAIGAFGRGMSTDYDHYLQGSGNAFTYITPEAGRYILSKNADGSYTNDQYLSLKNVKAYLNGDNTRTLKFKNSSSYTFDTNGRLTRQTDATGNYVSISRDSYGNITAISDSTGRTLYITNRTITIGLSIYTVTSSVMDSSGRAVTYTYDSSARLISTTNPDGGKTTYTYDSGGRLTSITNPKGIKEEIIEYDSQGRVFRQVNADSGEYLFYYFSPATPVRVQDSTLPLSSSCRPTFVREGDSAPANTCGIIYVNIPTSQSVPQGSTATTTIAQTVAIYPNKSSITHRFNSQGYLLSTTDGQGGQTTYERRISTNELISVTDKGGRKTSYTYDSNGNIATTTDPAGNVTRYEYDLILNKPIKITDALGNVTTMTYDAKGNLIKAVSPQLSAVSISYNSYGQPISITDALNNTTSFTYDSYGNLIKTTDPLGNSAQMQYDFIGRLIKAIDAKGKSTQYVYDLANRITEITDALSGKTKFSYDKNGNLLSVTDANAHTITYTYTVRDKVSTMTDQLGKVETYSYDKMDNLISAKDRKGEITSFNYDMFNRLTKTVIPVQAGIQTIEYFYDAIGRLSTINDTDSGMIQYSYSNDGCSACGSSAVDKVIQELTSLGNIGYEYDVLGRRTKMTVAGQEPVNYSYNANGQLTNILTDVIASGAWQSLSFDFAYDAIGRRTSLTRPNGVTTNYSYDNASQLLNIESLNPLNAVLEKIGYTYDKNGNRTSAPRLNVPIKMSQPMTATYNTANQMTTLNGYPLTYDENGNLLTLTRSCGTTYYTWNVRNQLVGINGFNSDCSSLSAAFKYDALGRRMERTVNGKTINYLYDNLDIVQEVEGGTVTVNYIRTLNIDEPLARIKTDGTIRYYQQDALGSVIALTDETGTIKAQYVYSPFGESSVIGEPSDSPFQFAGRENDGTGLLFERARYDSLELNRYISQDPLRFASGDVNWYARVGGNPVNRIDPMGLWGIGIMGTTSTEAGLVGIGAGQTGSVGGGLFGQGLFKNLNFGGFASWGGFAGGPGYGPSYPSGNSGNVVGGAYAGIGAGIFVTNAKCAAQLKGPFKTISLNVGIGAYKFTMQYSYSNGIGMFSVGPPFTGAGIGLSGSGYNTNTGTTKR
ncbi:MAG: RhsA [Nitrospirae bacterium]|nr:MAG: RhsA [Nitrospirota bacterium]